MPHKNTAAPQTAAGDGAGAGTPEATQLLADDHREVHSLFERYAALTGASAGGDERGPLAEEICTLLTVHAAIEEESALFPRCRSAALDLQALGQRLAARKRELMSEMSEGMEAVD